MDYKKLADMLFPNITKTIDDFEKLFPERNLEEGAMVTRLAPSPTGFIHLGNLYGALWTSAWPVKAMVFLCFVLKIQMTREKLKGLLK